MPVVVRCRGCRALIFWGVTDSGAKIPVDRKVAEGVEPNLRISARGVVSVVEPGEGTHVAHFATCPDAERLRSRTASRGMPT
jgi:hypothetical protein